MELSNIMNFIHKSNICTDTAVKVLSLLHVLAITSQSSASTIHEVIKNMLKSATLRAVRYVVHPNDGDVSPETCRRDKTFTAICVHMLVL